MMPLSMWNLPSPSSNSVYRRGADTHDHDVCLLDLPVVERNRLDRLGPEQAVEGRAEPQLDAVAARRGDRGTLRRSAHQGPSGAEPHWCR